MTKKEALKIDIYSLDSILAPFEDVILWDSLYYVSNQIEAVQKGWAD